MQQVLFELSGREVEDDDVRVRGHDGQVARPAVLLHEEALADGDVSLQVHLGHQVPVGVAPQLHGAVRPRDCEQPQLRVVVDPGDREDPVERQLQVDEVDF